MVLLIEVSHPLLKLSILKLRSPLDGVRPLGAVAIHGDKSSSTCEFGFGFEFLAFAIDSPQNLSPFCTNMSEKMIYDIFTELQDKLKTLLTPDPLELSRMLILLRNAHIELLGVMMNDLRSGSGSYEESQLPTNCFTNSITIGPVTEAPGEKPTKNCSCRKL